MKEREAKENMNLREHLDSRVRIKLCGLSRPEDIAAANVLLPDFIGFVFAKKSSRYVTPEQAAGLKTLLDPRIRAVGVFVDEDPEEIRRIAAAGIIDLVQLHGKETPEQVRNVKKALARAGAPEKTGAPEKAGAPEKPVKAERTEEITEDRIPVIQAFSVRTKEDLAVAAESPADFVLLDNGAGGTGAAFDWGILAADPDGSGNGSLKCFPRFFLAGGLTPENVGAAIKQCRPWAVDTSSALETAGKKDPEKMRAFVDAVRQKKAGRQKKARRQKKAGRQQEADGGRTTQDGGIQMSSQELSSQNQRGRFGIHGGQYIPETLMNAVIELEEAYNRFRDDPQFQAELTQLLNEYAGRPSRLYFAEHMTKDLGGAKIYLKREDLNHTGAHKINNALGQALLAKKMGKTRLIAETGAGQHGVATATAAAFLGMECVVYMGEEDTKRQALNVFRMRLLGAKVIPVTSGTATLKDAVSETFREWTGRIADTHYCLGSCMGPHPFPTIVRDFQAVISREIKAQILEKEGRLPDAVLACVGGGSNAIGTFYHFIEDRDVRLIGCEAAGRGIDTWETAATMNTGRLGIFHGMKSYFCQDEYGQIAPVYSISAGLDYPGIGPEHAWLHDIGRAEYVPVTDEEAVQAFEYLARTEGIIPAIESAHAVAYAMKIAPKMGKDQIMVITLSGRGDKDVAAIARYRGEDLHE